MKKILMYAILMIAMSIADSANAQVVFSKFKFHVADINNFAKLQLETKFKVTGEKGVKYVTVGWAAVNDVGDAICDDIVGGVNANVQHTKYHNIKHTGPYKQGKSYTSHFGIYYFFDRRKPTAFPYRLTIDYMGGGQEVIDITKENIGKYFPSVKWIDVDYKSGL